MTRTIKLNAIKNNKLTIINTIRLIRPCKTSSSVFKTTWLTLHSSPVLQSRRYMASSWPAVALLLLSSFMTKLSYFSYSDLAFYGVYGAAGLVVGILAVWLEKLFVVCATSLMGSLMFLLGG